VAWLKEYKKALIVIVILFIVGGLVAVFGNNSGTSSTTAATSNNSQSSSTVTSVDQDTISQSVVDILCTDSLGNGSGGSGTIITSDGEIVTNNHIIPEDADGTPTVNSCVITVPDTQGKVNGIYTAVPVVVPTLSQKYDIAFFKINGAYTNDLGITQGQYPATFTSYYDVGCFNSNPTLGEAVRIFGYPAISAGGYNLTITDGIVSSLPEDGTIITSAEIDHGDSGGLAVDENGCMIGIPSAVNSDGTGSLGIIMSNSVIGKFGNELPSTDTQNTNQ
jgi:putative serine protease PepD